MNPKPSIKLAACFALLAMGGCVSQSVGPGGVEQSAGPFHQSVGPGGVSQGAGPYGPSQSVSPAGVQQSAGPAGPKQSVTPAGVSQSSGQPPQGKCLNAGCKWDAGGASAGTACRATCAGHDYAITCPAAQRASCQCSTAPYASCVAPKK